MELPAGATMGQLIYGVAPAIQVDDWGLHHLEMVMLTRLRRGESFRFSWDDTSRIGTLIGHSRQDRSCSVNPPASAHRLGLN